MLAFTVRFSCLSPFGRGDGGYGDSDDGYGASRFGASRLHGLLITTRALGAVLRRLWMAFMGVAGGD